MTYELEHFKEFHDDPASFNDEDFRTKTLEWMIFVRETQGQYDFETEEWEEIGDRFYDELDARFPRTPELEAEYENLRKRLIEDQSESHGVFIKTLREMRDFVKRYQVEFQFSHQYVEQTEKSYNELVRINRNYEYNKKGLEYERQQALFRLDDSLAAHYEKTGKIPVLTALKRNKKFEGN